MEQHLAQKFTAIFCGLVKVCGAVKPQGRSGADCRAGDVAPRTAAG